MNEIQTSCASTDRKWNTWESIDWNKCEMAVNKLQARIVKAQKAGKHGRVKALQWVLTHSFYAKALAVKRVTSNRGSDTAGVDKVKWSTPKARFKAIGELKRGGYKPQPLKRVNIKKSNGKLRPLGIPTMKDRAMQALYLLALEPVSETTADSNSYGFRKERSTGDAREQCFCVLAKKASPEWIMEGDIKGCFDHISHEWLLNNIPMDKVMLRKWLKCGFVFNKELFPTEEGTPQGGIISPTLANITLDGLQTMLAEKYHKKFVNRKTIYYPKVHLVRYADDFIITGRSKEALEEIKPLVVDFLKERGLTLSEEKTKITRYVKVKGEANPFDPEWTEYFEKRKTYKMLQSLNGRKSLLYMWERQNHLCPVCGKPIDKKHPWGTSQQIVNGKKVNFLLHDSCRRKVIQTKKM